MISADGSKESDGEEQIAKQTENELEWTDRRLKDFATWQEAYIDYINKPESTIWTSKNGSDYSLIYVDDDYFWEGTLMTETEYKACLNKLIDTSKCIEPAELYTQYEMLEILAEADVIQ